MNKKRSKTFRKFRSDRLTKQLHYGFFFKSGVRMNTLDNWVTKKVRKSNENYVDSEKDGKYMEKIDANPNIKSITMTD